MIEIIYNAVACDNEYAGKMRGMRRICSVKMRGKSMTFLLSFLFTPLSQPGPQEHPPSCA